MPDGMMVEFDVHFARGSAGRKQLVQGEAPPPPDVPEGTVPRISRLMALAIRCADLIGRGEVADYAQLASLGHITRARMTQIMNLTNLAPDVQEEILFLPRTMKGRDPVGEQDIRPICLLADWKKQRLQWQQLLAGRTRTRLQG